MFRTRILSLLIFLSWSSGLMAQDAACSFSSKVTNTIGYTVDESASSGILNEMISVIAEDEVRNPRMIYFTLNSELLVRIDSPNRLNSRLQIIFGVQALGGHTRFRHFPMDSVLMPVRVSFSCRIEKKNGLPVVDLPDASDQKPEKNNSLVYNPIPYFSCDSDAVILHHFRFFYDRDALARFRKRVGLINDYYAANAILDSLDLKVRAMELGEVNRYPAYFITLEELNRVLAILKEKDLEKQLDLGNADPAGFTEKYQRLSRFSHSASMTFSENLKSPDPFVYSFSPDIFIGQFLDGISGYIRWSMLVTERNSGIYMEYLKSYFHRTAFTDDKGVIRNLARRMFPGMNPDSAVSMVSAMISKAYRDRANELMDRMEYAEAVDLLENSHDFSEANPYLKGKFNDRKILMKAANGIYNSFLGVADGAIRNGKDEMARTYMLRAQDYRKEHASVVSSDSLFNVVFQQLASETLSRCDGLYSSAQYPEAFDCYREFEKGFDSLTLSSLRQVLEPKIRFCRYRMLIGEGLANLAKPDKPEAGRYFFLARQLSQENHFPADTLLDSLCNVTYPFYLIHLLNSGETRIWTNRTGSAAKFADSIAYLQRTTGVESSRELSDVLATYKRKVETQTCWDAREAVDVFVLRAARERELRNFTVASDLMDSSLFIINNNPDCLIPSATIMDSAGKYSQAVDFQKMMKKIELSVSAGQYTSAVSAYAAMEHFYSSANVSRFGLSCVSLYDYVHDRSLKDLTIQAFRYFKGKKDVGEAFRYLKLLRLEDYPRKNARLFLEWAGKEYADKDFTDRPVIEPVTLVRGYTGQDPWMKRFRFAYYSRAQQLRNKPAIRYLVRKFFP